MSISDHNRMDAVHQHFEKPPEPFVDAAHSELASFPMHVFGECFNPLCSAHFKPAREWTKYCCDACRDTDRAAFRKMGVQTAFALFAWAEHRHAKDPSGAALSAKGRSHYTDVVRVFRKNRKAAVVCSRAARDAVVDGAIRGLEGTKK